MYLYVYIICLTSIYLNLGRLTSPAVPEFQTEAVESRAVPGNTQPYWSFSELGKSVLGSRNIELPVLGENEANPKVLGRH